jgi:hypothetical protein
MGKSQENPYQIRSKAASIFAIIEGAHNAHEVLDIIGVANDKVFKKKPLSCSICNEHTIYALELIGVANRPLFWECEGCSALFLREKRPWIEARITRLEGCFTTEQDWEPPERDNFN